jgi:DNA-nicking Smr family endonuclease
MPKKRRSDDDRRRATNRYAHLSEAQAVLDYHGLGVLSPDRIRELCRDFIEDARDRGLSRVRIVTGKGRNSANGPVVKPTVTSLLKKMEREGIVRSHQIERFDRGGDGALVVDL